MRNSDGFPESSLGKKIILKMITLAVTSRRDLIFPRTSGPSVSTDRMVFLRAACAAAVTVLWN